MIDDDRAKKRARTRFIVVLIGIGIVGLGVLGWFFVNYKSFSVGSTSMAPTLAPRDQLLVARRQPVQVGDVVVFRHLTTTWIARIVADGGDRVRMKAGRLFVNGTEIPRVDVGPGEPGLCWNGQRGRVFRETNGAAYLTLDCGPLGDLDETPEAVVPAGHYFMMGDNRDNSLDSRVSPETSGLGFVAASAIIGKVVAGADLPDEGRATDTP